MYLSSKTIRAVHVGHVDGLGSKAGSVVDTHHGNGFRDEARRVGLIPPRHRREVLGARQVISREHLEPRWEWSRRVVSIGIGAATQVVHGHATIWYRFVRAICVKIIECRSPVSGLVGLDSTTGAFGLLKTLVGRVDGYSRATSDLMNVL